MVSQKRGKLSLFYQIGKSAFSFSEFAILSTHSPLIKITNIKETITTFTEISPDIENSISGEEGKVEKKP